MANNLLFYCTPYKNFFIHLPTSTYGTTLLIKQKYLVSLKLVYFVYLTLILINFDKVLDSLLYTIIQIRFCIWMDENYFLTHLKLGVANVTYRCSRLTRSRGLSRIDMMIFIRSEQLCSFEWRKRSLWTKFKRFYS